MRRLRTAVILVIFSASCANAQDADTVLARTPQLLTTADTLSIFALLDSLIALEESLTSQLAIRVSYNSNVLSAGRTLGIENFGLSTGLSYYHKSGAFADLTGYYSRDFQPSYYLTTASLGYMEDFGKLFSVMIAYDRYVYRFDQNDINLPFKNAISITPLLDIHHASLSLNYTLYFGDKYGHRIMPSVSYAFEKRKIGIFDRVSITPTFFVLWGNELITTIEYARPKTVREAVENVRAHGSRFTIIQKSEDVFGLMNYAISVPVTASMKKWAFSFSYAYNIPTALPGEMLELSESSYLSGSILYFIDLRR